MRKLKRKSDFSKVFFMRASKNLIRKAVASRKKKSRSAPRYSKYKQKNRQWQILFIDKIFKTNGFIEENDKKKLARNKNVDYKKLLMLSFAQGLKIIFILASQKTRIKHVQNFDL